MASVHVPGHPTLPLQSPNNLCASHCRYRTNYLILRTSQRMPARAWRPQGQLQEPSRSVAGVCRLGVIRRYSLLSAPIPATLRTVARASSRALKASHGPESLESRVLQVAGPRESPIQGILRPLFSARMGQDLRGERFGGVRKVERVQPGRLDSRNWGRSGSRRAVPHGCADCDGPGTCSKLVQSPGVVRTPGREVRLHRSRCSAKLKQSLPPMTM